MDAFRGIWLVARTPRLWPLCFGPLLAAVALYASLGITGAALFLRRLPGWLGLESANGRDWWLAEILGGLAFVALWLVLFQFVFVVLGGTLSGLVWDKLSLAVERIATTGETSGAPLGCGAQAGDTLARLALNGTLGVFAFALAFVLGPLPGIAVAAMIGLLDYTAPAFLRRGLTLGPQWARLRHGFDRDTAAFALGAGLLLLVPLVGVLLLPGLVAGGTLLVLRRLPAREPAGA